MDNTGKKFHNWTIQKRAEKPQFVLCKCDCGSTREVFLPDLVRKKSKSCGCHRIKVITKHGQLGTPVYNTWKSMMSRCYNPNNTAFKNYGGRGIKVCIRWRIFEKFAIDMQPRPKNKTIDRINNNSNYSKSKCRWATRKEQANNRRNNVKVGMNG